jgi:hypothetical protein
MDEEEDIIVQLRNRLAARYHYLDDLQNGNYQKNTVLKESVLLRRKSRTLISEAKKITAAAKVSLEIAQESYVRAVLRIKSSKLRLVAREDGTSRPQGNGGHGRLGRRTLHLHLSQSHRDD